MTKNIVMLVASFRYAPFMHALVFHKIDLKLQSIRIEHSATTGGWRGVFRELQGSMALHAGAYRGQQHGLTRRCL